ncbi:MAG TPA: hypothetical protein VGJ00_00140, partial [Rhabdochlamydiaceae bacterium]
MTKVLFGKCIAFTGSPKLTEPCSHRSLLASGVAYQEIVKSYQEDPRLAPIIARFTPQRRLGEADYALIAERTRRKVVKMAQAVGIPVDNPEEVQLQGLIAWVEACNFNIFFKKLAQSINWDLIPPH